MSIAPVTTDLRGHLKRNRCDLGATLVASLTQEGCARFGFEAEPLALASGVADHKTRLQFFDRPGRREAAGRLCFSAPH
jgi:hypothetical protein